MLLHHLPQLISQLASLGRHAVGLCHAATRTVTVALDRLELSRNAGRAAFRIICPLQKRELQRSRDPSAIEY